MGQPPLSLIRPTPKIPYPDGYPNPTPTKTSELSKPTSIYFVGLLKKATKITLLFHPQSLFIHSPALLYLKEPYLLFLSIKINHELLKKTHTNTQSCTHTLT